jgi:hypothetical protein
MKVLPFNTFLRERMSEGLRADPRYRAGSPIGPMPQAHPLKSPSAVSSRVLRTGARFAPADSDSSSSSKTKARDYLDPESLARSMHTSQPDGKELIDAVRHGERA